MKNREFPTVPRLGVGAVVINETGHILLIKRANEPLKGHWALPGGLVEIGETLVAAVKREVLEETGIVVDPQAIVKVVERIYKQNDSPFATEKDAQAGQVRFHYVIVDYWCKLMGGEMHPGTDATEACWAGQDQWRRTGVYALDATAVEVIEQGMQMARMASTDEE